MKKIYAILLSMGVLSAVSSCDYLDVVPDNIATIEIAFNNRSTALNYLSTLYWYIPETGKIGSDPGICAAYNGGTHMPFEDCALWRPFDRFHEHYHFLDRDGSSEYGQSVA